MPRLLCIEHETQEVLCDFEAKVPEVGAEVFVPDEREPRYSSVRNVLHVVRRPDVPYYEVRLGRPLSVPYALVDLTAAQLSAITKRVQVLVRHDDRKPFEYEDLMVQTLVNAVFTAWRLSLMGGGQPVDAIDGVTVPTKTLLDAVGDLIRRIDR
jgi:hypothetical protein